LPTQGRIARGGIPRNAGNPDVGPGRPLGCRAIVLIVALMTAKSGGAAGVQLPSSCPRMIQSARVHFATRGLDSGVQRGGHQYQGGSGGVGGIPCMRGGGSDGVGGIPALLGASVCSGPIDPSLPTVGLVVNSNDAPIAHAPILILALDGSVISATATDDLGEFVVSVPQMSGLALTLPTLDVFDIPMVAGVPLLVVVP